MLLRFLFLVFFPISVLSVGVFFYWLRSPSDKPLCPKCNIVLIDIDILRADTLPCYGYKRNTTPNVCALAQKSQLLMDNYAQSTWTLPSMMSTITSQYPFDHGVLKTYRDALGFDTPSLAQVFKKQGYNTFFLGSVLPETITDINGGTRGYDVVQTVGVDGWPMRVSSLLKKDVPFFVHLYTNSLHMPYLLQNESQLLERIPRPAGFPVTSKEFSVLVGNSIYRNYSRVFTPLAISERQDLFASISANTIPQLTDYFWSLEKTNDPKRINNSGWVVKYDAYIEAIFKNEPLSKPFVRLLYDSVLADLDKNINNTLKLFNSPNYKSNTIIVVYSDHGEELGERGRFGHPQSLYNEIIRTPLILYIPGVVPQKIHRVTRNIDIFPTLTSLVGLKTPPGLKGVSLVPMVLGVPDQKQLIAISQSGMNGFSVYDGTWKLIVKNRADPISRAELYRLSMDPDETNNIVEYNLSEAQSLLVELTKTLGEKPTR